ncbi:PREDICTED: TRIO and F-actin-binding protein isoform X2 [Poecilia mexicana]|uniref:TRIO and F-actin-binding protein isoform X2 n=1 Tax=Poecilia mexicana TaxID=48701 RepID=UPI00072ECC52|nr:PREDICTED: TRIO and F-actin-binding protein isoform X2 [Poecilia mexicana]
MSHSSDEPTCPKFQPNIFDPSRCHECLRQRHLHASAGERTELEPQQKPLPEDGDATGKSSGLGGGIRLSRAALLTPISSQTEERDTSSSSNKEDSDTVSVVSSCCDVNGGQACNEETSLCILSSDCKLYICEDDDTTDSSCDQSEEFTCSVSTDEEYLPIRSHPTKLRMTRLDPPPHRPNPRQAWMEETQGLKEDREKRESGYYSLGRSAGARFTEKSPPTPFRHFERGHPIFSHRNIEPKDTIPFRNPNLGVASERPIPEVFNEDLTVEIPPPDPYEVAVEVEAQVGPRSPSPTPFKIAESLASTGRKGLSRTNPLSNISSYQQSGRYDSSRQGSVLQSRSSSPSRENLQLRHSESSSILSRTTFDSGGRTQAPMQGSRSSLQGVHARRFESGTLPRNFKSFASSLKSQSSTVSDFRSALKKTEANSSSAGLGSDKRSSSPSRREYNSSVQMSRSTDVNTSSTHHTFSPSRTYDRFQESRASSPPRRNFNSSSQSLRKSESITSLNDRSHLRHNGSPVSSPPPRRNFNSSNQSLRKSESITSLNERSRHNNNGSPASSPPPRRNFNSSSQSLLHKSESITSLKEHSHRRRSGSPVSTLQPGRNFNYSNQSLRKSESITSLNDRSHHQRSSSPVTSMPQRKHFTSPNQSFLRKSESITSLNDRHHHGRCGSPVREGYGIEGQAQLRNLTTRNELDGQECEVSTVTLSRHDSDRPRQSILRKTETSGSRCLGSRSSSPSRRAHETFAQGRGHSDGSLNGHLHKNCNSSPSRQNFDAPSQSQRHKTEFTTSVRSRDANSSLALRGSYDASDYHSSGNMRTGSSFNSKNLHTSRSPSPSRKGNIDPPGYMILRSATKGDSSVSFKSKNTNNETKYDSRSSSNSCRGSTHSIRSSSVSRSASPSRQTTSNRAAYVTLETSRTSGSMRSRAGRHGHDDHHPPPHDKRSSRCARSPSPPPQMHIQTHTSSQSSMESSESGRISVGSTGRNREEYAAMADLPKVKMIHQKEGPGHMGRPQSHQPVRRQELFKPASHSLSRHPSIEWDDPGDMDKDWHYGGSGYLSRAHSTTSLQRSGSPTADEGCSWKSNHHRSEEMQPDLLNFKKGWMSKLDDCGEWKKHWFVLTDAGLKYYRDSTAEEKDDLDGEIDLKSCLKVSEFNVEKNYGFQIQTREAVFTLSAMTAGIRRNWIEVLKKSIRPSSSPDLTQLPDNNSDKENSHKRLPPSSRRPLSRHADSQSETPSSAHPAERRFDYVELSPVPASSSAPLPSSQREAGEGQGREHSQWQEERSTSSQWEAVLSRKGSGVGSNQKPHLDDEIERKWSELERMPLKDMSSLSSMGSRTSSQPANEALQREVASLRQQLEKLQQGGREGGRGGSVRSDCGPEAPCSRSLAAMERAHRHALEELQRQHDRQMRELEMEKERLLLEETQDTARVMETLKKKHKEELEREVEKVRRLSSGKLDSHSLQTQQQAETLALQRELAGLSERYSQKCLELNKAEQRNAEREREVSRRERDVEQLRKENVELKSRLTDEMSRTRSALTDRGSEDDKDKTSCELEVLLRMKDNEIEYLHKEISCLRNELQFLNMEKQLACERYAEVHGELNGMRGRTEREIQSLKEHLRLAMAALQEGQKLGNSLDH